MPGRDCSRLISSTIPGNLLGTSRSDRGEREASPSSEHDPPKQGLTFPKGESTILLDPTRLESLSCLSFSRRGLRATSPGFCVPNGGII
jgi:hypothetical protein